MCSRFWNRRIVRSNDFQRRSSQTLPLSKLHAYTVQRMVSGTCALAAVLIAANLYASPLLRAESPARTRLDGLRQEVKAAHAAGDSATYLGKSRELMDSLHATPSSILQVMSAQAFGGDDDAALDSFEKFVGAGQSAPEAFQSEVFARLRGSERFKTLEARMRKNEETIASSSAVLD